jgi:hypothetical protein
MFIPCMAQKKKKKGFTLDVHLPRIRLNSLKLIQHRIYMRMVEFKLIMVSPFLICVLSVAYLFMLV